MYMWVSAVARDLFVKLDMAPATRGLLTLSTFVFVYACTGIFAPSFHCLNEVTCTVCPQSPSLEARLNQTACTFNSI